jgi:beta-lactamase regulating signal transducer with metallopeptidase domain
MTFLGSLLMQLMWTALATVPAAVAAVLFTHYSAGSPRLKTWVCRGALVSAVFVLLAIGVQVQASLRHERSSGELGWLLSSALMLLVAVWAGGAIRRIAGLFRARANVRELCALATPLPSNLEATLRRKVDCPEQVEMRASDFVDTVVIVYGASPTIVIPARLLFDEDLPLAVSHELAHLHHRDSAWNLLYEAIATILWFSPAILALGKRMRICQELAADAAAIRRHECGAGRYGKMLLRFADVAPSASPFMAALGAKGDMVERLEALKPVALIGRILSVACFALVLAAMVPMRSADAPSLLGPLHHTLRHLHH